MILDLMKGKYRIETDDNQFIVQERRIVQKAIEGKTDNIGKPYYKDIAYCGNFESSLNHITNRAFMNNDDIQDVIKEIKTLQKEIKNLSSLLNLK